MSAYPFEQLFEVLLFMGRQLVENALQKRGVHLEQRNKHGPTLWGKGNRSHAPIRLAFQSADQALLVQSIHSYADRPRIEIHFGPDRVDWHWTLVHEDVKDPEIRVPQVLLEYGRHKEFRDRLPCLQQNNPSMDRFRRFDFFHNNLNPLSV